MSLSCSCNYDYEFEPGDWYYDSLTSEFDFEPLVTTRRKRCCSCGELIDIGALSIRHDRIRYPYNELESRKKLSRDLEDAMADEASIKIAPHYNCENCGEIWLNLQNVGFECLSPDENMQDALKEYQTEYNPKKLE